MLHWLKFRIWNRSRKRKCKRIVLDSAINGAPEVDQTHATFAQISSLIRKMSCDSCESGSGSLIDVCAQDRASISEFAANRVVKDEDTLGTRNVLKEKLLDFGIEVTDDICTICEGVAMVWYVGNSQNSVAVEVELIF